MIRLKAIGNRLIVLAVIVLVAGIVISASAWSKDYLLELTITTDKQEEYVFLAELDDRQYRNLRNDSNNEIKNYLVDAQRKYADEIGYRKEIYGDENYKMVVIVRYDFIIKEKSSGRILLKK
ncbi:MAG: hypothetical protein ACOYXC_15900 [Candidatus Rifleibacteriota bacterium]